MFPAPAFQALAHGIDGLCGVGDGRVAFMLRPPPFSAMATGLQRSGRSHNRVINHLRYASILGSPSWQGPQTSQSERPGAAWLMPAHPQGQHPHGSLRGQKALRFASQTTEISDSKASCWAAVKTRFPMAQATPLVLGFECPHPGHSSCAALPACVWSSLRPPRCCCCGRSGGHRQRVARIAKGLDRVRGCPWWAVGSGGVPG